MSTGVKVLLGILIAIVLIGGIAAFVMFGPPKYGEKIAQPEFCASCHIMQPQYDAYKAGTHSDVTDSCNDCHLPNTGFVRHWTADAFVGIRDVVEWNLNMIPERTVATDRSRRWIEENCRRCHKDVISTVHPPAGRNCWECHRELYHDIQHRQDRKLGQPVWEEKR